MRIGRFTTPTAEVIQIEVTENQFDFTFRYAGADGKFGRLVPEMISPATGNALGLDVNDPAGKDDVVMVNQLHVELNRPTICHITSKDVIHSFFLPVMRVKQDAIPGMDVPVHFTPIKANNGATWEIACAQLCGNSHYRMRGQLTVDTHDEFVKWMKSQTPVLGGS